MSVSEEPTISDSRIDGHAPIISSPKPTLSMEDTISYHMIQDTELTLLAQPEAGTLGSIGFTAVGAGIGVLPGFVNAFNVIFTDISKIQPTDLTNLIIMPVSLVIAALCLAVWGLAKYRNSGLTNKIRSRRKRDMTVGS